MAGNFAYATGTLSTINDLIMVIDNTMTTELDADNSWERVFIEYDTVEANIIRKIIWRGKGSGQENIYIGMRTTAKTTDSSGQIDLNGFAGFDEALTWEDQPGNILKSPINTTLPCIPMTNNSLMSYWLIVNSQRIAFVVKMSTQYESAYLGFFNPIDSERQYPYPMYIGGSGTGTVNWANTAINTRGSIVLAASPSVQQTMFTPNYPAQTAEVNNCTARIRRSDGEWRGVCAVKDSTLVGTPFTQCTLWPYNIGGTKMVPIYRATTDTTLPENYLLLPVLIIENYPHGIVGVLDGIKYISGTKDIGAEQLLVLDDERQIVFDTMNSRTANSYFTMVINK